MQLLTKKENIDDKGVIDSNELLAPLFSLQEKIQELQNNISSLQLNIQEDISKLNLLFNSQRDIDKIEETNKFEELKKEVSISLSNIKDTLDIISGKKSNRLNTNKLPFIIDDGYFLLNNILTLEPRILPRNAKKGSIGLDVKDGKLKVFNETWREFKLE